jgi:uncharacterized protein YigA (DUF484 family)
MNPTEHPITEDDIANFLANTPDFFERHAELLATVQLSSGHGSRAVSLQERQAGMLREKIKGLETRVVEMIRHGNDNEVIASRLQRWTQRMLQVQHAQQVPAAIVAGLIEDLQIPQAGIRVWDTSPALASEAFTHGVSEDIRTFTASLTAPYCGINSGFEAVSWLADSAAVQSLALIPLVSSAPRAGAVAPVSGLLILASADAERFQAGMGVDFLEQLGQMAGACLARLQVAS